MKGGLSRVLHKRDVYERLLRQFTTGPESRTVEEIRRQLAGGDTKAAERMAHSLKSVAGTLGADELQQRAAGLETAIKKSFSEAKIDTHIEEVRQELSRIITAIQDALPTKEAPEIADATKVDWDRAREAVNRLEEMLEGNDAGAINAFEESADLLRAVFGSTVSSVEASLANFDFSAALKALRTAKADHDGLTETMET